tara:strand:- start:105 stop:305 length:201 start_codon:yes stop_codon:yes gene_type:complete
MSQDYTDFIKDSSSTENTSGNQMKTTDVNILLNRVRLDKKKTFKKKILSSILAVGLVCSITIFLII